MLDRPDAASGLAVQRTSQGRGSRRQAAANAEKGTTGHAGLDARTARAIDHEKSRKQHPPSRGLNCGRSATSINRALARQRCVFHTTRCLFRCARQGRGMSRRAPTRSARTQCHAPQAHLPPLAVAIYVAQLRCAPMHSAPRRRRLDFLSAGETTSDACSIACYRDACSKSPRA
jgi:hypothetical protein